MLTRREPRQNTPGQAASRWLAETRDLNMKKDKLTRRDFLRVAGVTTAGLALSACGLDATKLPNPTLLPSSTPLPIPSTTPSATSTPRPTQTPLPPTFRSLADRIGFEIGVYFSGTDSVSLKIARENFNHGQIFVGWSYSEAERNQFDLTSLKYYGNFARKNHMTTQAGMLVWAADLPNWVKHSNFNRDELIAVLRHHISKIISPFKGKVKEWVVVNESYLPPYRTDDIFHKIIGQEYIEIAFQAARESDPDAVLIYNDYDNHTSNGTTTKLSHQIVDMLHSKGLIDGVGLQMHLFQYETTPPDKQDVISTMKSYGIPIYVTEFDVNLKNISGTLEQRYEFQAGVYRDMLEATLESGACKGFTVFGTQDNLSAWETIQSLDGYSPDADPLLFDSSSNPKPAFFAMMRVFQKYAQGS
jgi:endo-1,4-beta-xylanase